MGKYIDLSESIKDVNKALIKAKGKKRTWKDDSVVLELFSLCKQIYWSQIHEYLTSLNSDWGEQEIRRLVREIITTVLPLCVEKVKDSKKDLQVLDKYLQLYDDFFALASFRSLSHFVQYMEFDKKAQEKIWQPTMHLFNGYWFYTGSMILNGDIKFISKQCFTGLGKTYSNAMTLAFIYGYDINADALYVFGANENVGTFATGLVDLMISNRYSKVFPYYAQFHGEDESGLEDKEITANKMFSVKQIKDNGSKLRIAGSSKPINLRVVSKDKNTNGVRAKFLFLDDIAQLADANNPKAHEKDIFRLTNEWFKRNYDLRNFFIIAGGTTYSVDDILTYLLRMNNGDLATVSKINKYTSVSHSNFIVKDGVSVFVRIPKLDYETDESTYPEKYPTEEARMQRNNALDNGRMFSAMEQQMPLSSEENPFDWGNIHIYETLPKTVLEGGTRNNRCRFIFDPSRTGKDKTCCLFFSQDEERHYFVDAFCENQPLDHIYKDGETVLEKICDKIIQHKCFEGAVEENTESTIVSQIEKCLANKKYGGKCNVEGYYSYKVKKDKIYNAQTAIQSYLWFPSRRVFSANSMVGQAMTDITYWKYKENIPDDSPECCAVYSEKYITDNRSGFAVCHTFKR